MDISTDNPLLQYAERSFRYRWYAVIPGLPMLVICLLVGSRYAGWITDQPLDATRIVLAIKYGLMISFPIGLIYIWRDSRKLFAFPILAKMAATLTIASDVPSGVREAGKDTTIRWLVLKQLKIRSMIILGGLSGNVAMLIGLYIILRLNWLLAITALYSLASSWYFRPRIEKLMPHLMNDLAASS